MTKGKVFGANERIGVCCMGLNGRGGDHMKNYAELDDAEIVALVDPDQRVLDRAMRMVEKMTGKAPQGYADIRDALANDAVHAVSIATPNNWHTLGAIWACQAGKDVFVEKPISHEVWEGRQIAAAAKKYGRIVQHGTQGRSKSSWLRDVPLLQSGEIIGKVYYARGLCYKSGNRGPVKDKPGEPPAELNWDLWQGPATRQAYNGAYHPYNWHWFWHYGNGEIGNQGIHQMDICSWVMDGKMPVKVYSMGGRYTYEDAAETPNTNVATFTYDDGTMTVFEVRNRWTNTEEGVDVGNLFYADEGYYVEGKGFFNTKNEPIPLDESKYPTPEGGNHYANFLKAVRSRKQEDIRGTALQAHHSASHCHLANISYRLGRALEFDPKTEQFVSDEEANAMVKRTYAEGFEVPQLA
ncbi:MAG: Gfo/Idh/MocA family oxidoreductase [Candidatus Hydrogenedentes bacterium]|nr:Gfo/Idh/MocA family oxidoreductase [Candidatus Hydrogenedentota bacterium]